MTALAVAAVAVVVVFGVGFLTALRSQHRIAEAVVDAMGIGDGGVWFCRACCRTHPTTRTMVTQ